MELDMFAIWEEDPKWRFKETFGLSHNKSHRLYSILSTLFLVKLIRQLCEYTI